MSECQHQYSSFCALIFCVFSSPYQRALSPLPSPSSPSSLPSLLPSLEREVCHFQSSESSGLPPFSEYHHSLVERGREVGREGVRWREGGREIGREGGECLKLFLLLK